MIPQLEIDLALECLGLVEKKTGYGRDPVCFKILIGEDLYSTAGATACEACLPS